jgi:hypothetical protein
MPRIVHAPYPIKRPYTPLFMLLREQCNALIDQMERKTERKLPPTDRSFVTEEWEQYSPGLIIGSIDWDNARLILNWAVDDDNPVRATRSPDYLLDLTELKQAANATDQPRAYFNSYALFILEAAQDHLGEFYRDGPTDDIPYDRHLIYARGLNGDEATVWIGNIHFTWDDRHG